MYNIAISDCDWCEYECMVVLGRFIIFILVADTVPRILLYMYVSFLHVAVFGQKVSRQHDGKFFG